MANYYGGYRRRRGLSAARSHISQRHQLTRRFGGVDRDVEKEFFALSERQSATLFYRYGAAYGDKAEAYARDTYLKWKRGSVQMSGQTAERLLNLVPPLLEPATRFQLIRKLRAHHIGTDTVYLIVGFDNWRDSVFAAVAKIVQKSQNANLPGDVISVARWLAQDDARAAQALLAQAEQEDARIRTSLLEQEIALIQAMASRLVDTTNSFRHVIRIPHGEIHLFVETPKRKSSLLQWLFGEDKKMSDEQDKSKSLERIANTAGLAKRPDVNLLDVAVEGLSPKDVEQIRARALEEKLRLDVGASEADQRFFNTARQMAADVRTARELDQGRNDFSIDSTHATASGQTTVRIKKSTNMGFMVVAVIVGVVALLLLLNR